MGYRRALLTRWSQRDRLTVLVIAVTVAFLTGTALLVLAIGGQTTAIAAEFDSPGSITYVEAPTDMRPTEDVVVLPVAQVEQAGVTSATVVGPPSAAQSSSWLPEQQVPSATESVTRGDITSEQTVRLAGPNQSLTLTVTPRKETSLVSPQWYVANASVVSQLGQTGAFVLHNGEAGSVGSPLVSALRFFITGTQQALNVLTVIAGGGAVLVGVTVYSVTRMSVRDRLTTIRTIRATGATATSVLSLFALRSCLLTSVGVALGYAIGTIVPSMAVNLAVALGVPLSLPIAVTVTASQLLAPLFGVIIAVGGLAGGLAAWSTVRQPPAHITTTTTPKHESPPNQDSTLRSRLSPSLLGWRALIPTTATLAVFIAFVILTASIAGVVGAFAAADSATITESGSVHPATSTVPTSYADPLRARGINASPEILLFETYANRPLPARGANFSAFAAVSGAALTTGHQPQSVDEAVIGEDLAQSHNIRVGETVTLGGSTQPAFTRVTIVGTFAASGPYDDQLLVSLPTARHLAGKSDGTVHFIRADRLPTTEQAMPTGVSVTDLQAPTAVAEGEPFTVNITVRNDALSRENHSLTVQYRNQTATQELTLQASGQQTVTQQFPAGSQGNYSLTVDNESRTIQVVSSQTARISNLPERAPPTSAPLVQARTIQGTPLTNATVLIGAQRVQTNASGYVRLPLDSPGEYSPRIEGRPTLTRNSITVEQGARKTFVTDLRVRPRSPSAVTQPTAHLVIYNPWNETLTQKITVRGAGKQTTDSVTLSPEMQATRTMTLPRRTAGTYSVEATTARDTLARTNYTVVSDERLAAAIASSGRTGTTGIGQAVEVAFGNFQLVLPTLVVLAGIMTIGGTTATFAQTVHARRQTVGIYRATGATPGEILKIILGDALRIGFLATALATIIAVSALAVLDTLGLLVVFGVRLSSLPDATVFFAVWGGSLFITLLGTVFATLSLITVPPVTLLSALQPRVPGSDADE